MMKKTMNKQRTFFVYDFTGKSLLINQMHILYIFFNIYFLAFTMSIVCIPRNGKQPRTYIFPAVKSVDCLQCFCKSFLCDFLCHILAG